MKTLYFSPLACSLAARIVLAELGLEAAFVEVDPKTKRTEDGRDYTTVHPLGLVPLLELDDGEKLTENAAILQHVGALGDGRLVPRDPMARTRLQEWLSFIGTELHKLVYFPLLSATAPAGAKEYALSKADARLSYLAKRLEGRETLLDDFSVADAYLFTVLHWSQVTPIDLASYPSLAEYVRRLARRPSVAKAVAAERSLYARELERRKAEKTAESSSASP